MPAPLVLTVDTAADENDAVISVSGGTVQVTNPDNHLSLREAILAANANTDNSDPNPSNNYTLINFAIGPGVQTITPTTPLPLIYNPTNIRVVIDGSAPVQYPSEQTELDGTMAGGAGLQIGSPSTIFGLIINRFTDGIVIDAGDTKILSDYIGIGADGLTALGNTDAGIVIDGTQVSFCNIEGNTLSANAFGIKDLGGSGNRIVNNAIGTDASGLTALGNTLAGIYLTDIADNETIQGNLISGNQTGILDDNNYFESVATHNTQGNVVQGNFIGTDATGLNALPNGVGIELAGGEKLDVIESNVISGNSAGSGIGIGIWDASNGGHNQISSNLIGIVNELNSDGTVTNHRLGNYIGVKIMSKTGVAISGDVLFENFISGNTFGVYDQGGFANFFVNNGIGVDTSGNGVLGNQYGIFLKDARGETIGATDQSIGNPNVTNYISGNVVAGIVDQNGVGNVVQGNRIGTNSTGTSPLGNGDGVDLESASGDKIRFNIIAGNTVGVLDHNGTGNVVDINDIGTDQTRTRALGNAIGILLSDTTGDRIGSGIGNAIAFNGKGVVIIGNGTGNAIVENSFFSNAGPAIDLGNDGVSPNHPGTATGPNNFQNYPVLTGAAPTGNALTITGTFSGAPNTTFILQFYSSPVGDPSGFGQGQVFLGSTTVTTDAAGDAKFTVTVNGVTVALGQFITATATDPQNNTSEFSNWVAVTAELVLATEQTPVVVQNPTAALENLIPNRVDFIALAPSSIVIDPGAKGTGEPQAPVTADANPQATPGNFTLSFDFNVAEVPNEQPEAELAIAAGVPVLVSWENVPGNQLADGQQDGQAVSILSLKGMKWAQIATILQESAGQNAQARALTDQMFAANFVQGLDRSFLHPRPFVGDMPAFLETRDSVPVPEYTAGQTGSGAAMEPAEAGPEPVTATFAVEATRPVSGDVPVNRGPVGALFAVLAGAVGTIGLRSPPRPKRPPRQQV